MSDKEKKQTKKEWREKLFDDPFYTGIHEGTTNPPIPEKEKKEDKEDDYKPIKQ
jgi:hypothetical protein